MSRSGRPRRRGCALGRAVLGCCAMLLGTASVWPAGGAAVAHAAQAAAQAAQSAAQPGAGPAPGSSALRLEVRGLDGVLTPERDLRVQVQVHNRSTADVEDVRVVATVHSRLVGRWQLRQAVEEGSVGNIVHPTVVELDPVPAGGSRTVEVVQSADEVGLVRETHEGVYPLRLQLLADADVVDEVVTGIVVVPAAVDAPLDVALLLPLALPPARDAEGVVVDDALLDALDEDGALTRTAEVLTAHPELTAVVGLDGQTLADVADLGDGFALRESGVVAVRDAAAPTAARAREALAALAAASARARVEAVAMPYASGDLTALVRNDLADEAARHITDGAAAVEWMTGRPPVDDVLWPADEVDGATLALARRSGVGAVVARHGWLANGGEGDLSPPPVRRLTTSGGSLTAFVPDPYLERAIGTGSGRGGVIDAQRVLAEIASVYYERPGTPERGVVVAPPAGGAMPGDLLDALAGPLSEAPFVRGTTLAQLQRRVGADTGAVAQLRYSAEARRRELPPTYTGMLADARRAVGSLGAVLDPAQPLPARFDRLLLQSASVHYRGESLPRGRDLLHTVAGTVDDLYGAVELLDSPPVTLTAVQGELPVTIRSNADIPMRVRVGLRTARYDVEGGPVREVTLEPDSTQILTFDVRAVSPGGTSPVQVVVSDRDGVLQLTSGTIVVRSTAFSVVGLVITLGAAVFLVLWGLRQASRRRQGRDRGVPPPRRTLRRVTTGARAAASGHPPAR